MVERNSLEVVTGICFTVDATACFRACLISVTEIQDIFDMIAPGGNFFVRFI